MPGHVPDPIVVLPDHYREVHTISINDQGMLLKLNALSLIPLIAASLITFGALLVYHEEMGAPLVIDTLPRQLPGWVGLALLRKAWLNLDTLWALALIAAGVITLFT